MALNLKVSEETAGSAFADASTFRGVESGASVRYSGAQVKAAVQTNFTTSMFAAGVIDTDGTLVGNSDTKLATQKAVKTYADQLIAANDAMVFKGVIDASANPNYPAADRGNTYRISVSGKIGGASGTNVEAGDLLLCLTDGTIAGTQAAVGASWTIAQTNLDGAVIGPASVTDNTIALFSGTSGKLLKAATLGATLAFSGVALQTAAATGDVTWSANSFATTIGATKVTSAMLNADVYSTAHTWSAVQTINLNAASAPTAAAGTGIQLVGTDATVARYEVDSFGAIAAVTVRRANNTGASPTALASLDQIGAFNFHGYYVTGGPAYSGPQASIQGFATQAWTSTANGTKIVLSTTPNSSTTLTTALTIDQDQSVTFAGTVKAFTLGGTIAGGGNQINNIIIGTTTPLAGSFTTGTFSGNVSVTNSIYGVNSLAGLQYRASGEVAGKQLMLGPDISSTTGASFLSSAAAATLQQGLADAASPVAQTIKVQGVVAGTSNTAGADWTLKASAGTGIGPGGSIIFQVAPAGSTGTSQNAYATALTIDSTKTATFALNVIVGTSVQAGAGFIAPNGGNGYKFSSQGFFVSSSDGVFKFSNAVDADFGRLQFGGTTSSFPALKRSSTVLQARLADDSAFAPLQGALRTAANAVTGLVAGSLAALTNATIVVTDASGQDYRIPCVI